MTTEDGNDAGIGTQSTDTETTPADSGTVGAEAKFTQEQVDAFFAERLEREKRKLAKKYADYDVLKKQADELAQLREAEKSELEKLADKLAEEQKARMEAENLATERLIRAEIQSQAASLGFVSPAHAWALLDLADINVDAEGKVAGVVEALEALAKEHPYLLGKVSAPDIDARKGAGQRTSPVRLSPDEARAAEELNMTPEAYAAMKTASDLTKYRKLTQQK